MQNNYETMLILYFTACIIAIICHYSDNFALFFSPLYLIKLFQFVCVLLIYYVLGE